MNPDPRPTPAPVAPPAINYLKLTLSLMAVVLFAEFIDHWDDFKAGFTAGYNDAAGR
jgi:hypothetical protein